jgi:hypothetical protein
MKQEVKNQTVTLGELKKTKIEMPKKWLDNLWKRYGGKDVCQIDVKDLVNKIIKTKITKKEIFIRGLDDKAIKYVKS